MKTPILPTLLIAAASTGAVYVGHLARTQGRRVTPEAPPPEGAATAEPSALRPTESGPRPRIDVVFALDTTGSMGGLLEGAKRKIWSLANELVSGQPRPDVRIGLIAYRDRGDTYVTQLTPLSRDVDGVHAALLALSPGGGGDAPEDVNAALRAAISPQMGWEDGGQVLRLVFLVGDAPPHEDYQGPKSWQLAAQARARGIVVHTLRCGASRPTELAWRRIATAAGGDFATVPQDGGMLAEPSPYDDELAELNRELANTVIDYGTDEERRSSRRKRTSRSALKGAAGASAASFNAKAGRMNDEDLITQLDAGQVTVDAIEAEALPAELRALPKAEQKARVQAMRSQRARVTQRILEVSKERDAYLAKKRKTAPDQSALDRSMLKAVKKNAHKVGLRYAE